jgi:hypothetical protein
VWKSQNTHKVKFIESVILLLSEEKYKENVSNLNEANTDILNIYF